MTILYGPLHKDITMSPLGIEVQQPLSMGADGILCVPLKIAEKLVNIVLGKINFVRLYDPLVGYHLPVADLPVGLLRVFVIRGHTLPVSVSRIRSKLQNRRPKSFVELSVGRHTVVTPAILGADPVWNFYCEFGIQEPGHGAGLALRVMVVDSQEMTGCCHIDLANLRTASSSRSSIGAVSEICCKTWTSSYKTGKVELRIQWLPLASPQPTNKIGDPRENEI